MFVTQIVVLNSS